MALLKFIARVYTLAFSLSGGAAGGVYMGAWVRWKVLVALLIYCFDVCFFDGVDLFSLEFVCRKLLNQLIGYNQSIPALAEGVDPRGLGDQLAPLWMCYW